MGQFKSESVKPKNTMKTPTILQRRTSSAALVTLCLAASQAAFAQVGSINSAVISPREWNDIPGATLTTIASYPSVIVFSEQNVSQVGGYANRDTWRFSNNGGTSAYAFANNDYFQVSMTLQLIGNPTSPRKEAGFLLNTIGGDGQFIVNTDGHEIVAFGGPLPFYAFPATFDSSEIVTLGMTYFLDSNTGLRSIVYSANGVNSPILALSNLEQGIIDGSTLGGYFQIQNNPNNPSNFGAAVFQNVSISGIAVPEPSAVALLSLGVLPFVLAMRRRQTKASL
ncbi:MAG: PEP-CTERM sorting domain-containing protein [Verrucomicrobia subdivision 3 bacterium]|nr:PEP-CTERM sorting domain-containing protein [Limisphaerales bacterium]